eukprot:scaffold322792_cov83-Cyclotella_meneghiniana.AAC.4
MALILAKVHSTEACNRRTVYFIANHSHHTKTVLSESTGASMTVALFGGIVSGADDLIRAVEFLCT